MNNFLILEFIKEAMLRREALVALLSAPSLLTLGGEGAKTLAQNVGKAHFSAMASSPIKKITGVDVLPIAFKAKSNYTLLDSLKSNHTLLDRLKNNSLISRRKFVKSTATDAARAHTPANIAITKIAPKAPGLAVHMLKSLGDLIL
jgi:hypothetical protein